MLCYIVLYVILCVIVIEWDEKENRVRFYCNPPAGKTTLPQWMVNAKVTPMYKYIRIQMFNSYSILTRFS
jgi:hypothetical protein